MIFKSMVSWFLARSASKDSHRWSSIVVTLLVLWYRLVTFLAARRCTISTLLTYSLVWGFQTVEQYSMIGLTMEKSVGEIGSWLCLFILNSQVVAKKSKSAVSFLDRCFLDMLDWSSTPRYHVKSSIWRVCHFRVYDDRIGFLALVTLMALHFSG